VIRNSSRNNVLVNWGVLKFLNVCRQRPKGKKAWHSILFAATQLVATVGETRTLHILLQSRFNIEEFLAYQI